MSYPEAAGVGAAGEHLADLLLRLQLLLDLAAQRLFVAQDAVVLLVLGPGRVPGVSGLHKAGTAKLSHEALHQMQTEAAPLKTLLFSGSLRVCRSASFCFSSAERMAFMALLQRRSSGTRLTPNG